MSTFRFLWNTPLSFVRAEDWNKLQTERNRLYADYSYIGRILIPFVTEFDFTDPCFFQFRTDYLNHTISIVDKNGTVTTDYLTKTLVKTYDDPDSELYGLKQYNVAVDVASLAAGSYYLKVSATDFGKPILNFRSEPFKVKTSELLKLEWYGSTVLNDPFVWSINASMRVPGDVRKITPLDDSSFYVTTDGNRETTYAVPTNARILQVEEVPEWVVKLLELVTAHEQFWINEVLYGRGENWSYEAGANIIYSPKITVIEKNYYNFTSDETLTGTTPVYPVRRKLIDATHFSLIDTTHKTNIQ